MKEMTKRTETESILLLKPILTNRQMYFSFYARNSFIQLLMLVRKCNTIKHRRTSSEILVRKWYVN